MGYVKSYSGIQNNDNRLGRLKSQMTLAASLAEINSMQEGDKEKRLDDAKNIYMMEARGAYDKLLLNN